jgi:ribonuclease BN (tRNA processing enzyme)
MRIELLGTGGYFANSRRHTACVLLPECGIVFDGGSGLFRIAGRCQTRQLHVFLSHAHLDHVMGLPYLLLPALDNQFEEIAVHAESSVLKAVERHLFAEPIFPVPMPFRCEPLSATGTIPLTPATRVSWQPLPSHPGGSMAYRVDQSPQADGEIRRVAYVTDTCTDGSYTEFIRGCDLLIHECYFADDRKHLAQRTGHSCASDVARLAAEAEVQQLVVVHVDPTSEREDPIDLPAMQRIFPNTLLGTDELVIRIPDSDGESV